MAIIGMAGGPPQTKRFFTKTSGTAAISPEQAAIDDNFNPDTDTPLNPDKMSGMLKPIGHYQGWGGLQSIGEGLYNRAVWGKIDEAHQQQRASSRAAGEAIQGFVTGGGMAAGPEAIAKLMANPQTRAFGAQQQQRWDQLNDPLRQAQIDFYKSRTGLNDTKSNVMQDRAGPEPQAADANVGMDEDGNLITLRPTAAPAGVPQGMAGPVPRPASPNFGGGQLIQTGGGQTEGDILTPPHLRSAASPVASEALKRAGTKSGDVPDIVTQDGQTVKSDPYATKEMQGQNALKSADEEARARYLNEMERRRRNDHVYGKAPSSMRWNDDGSLEDLKDATKKKLGREKIGALIEDVKTSKDVLTNSNVAQRALGHVSGGWMFPEKEQAARAVEHAVSFMTAEVEGKRHANAQDVRMLRFFAPAPTDSTEMVGFKLDQLHRIMQGYFGQKEPSGAVFKSLLSKAQEARLAREGQAPSAPTGMTGAPPPPKRPAAYDRLGLE